MHAEAKPSYAFLVVTYNHQEYILEHLESIKYLVGAYGAGLDVDVIINDDCSRDQTRALVDRWLAVNANIFRNVKTIYNTKNLGTCASVNNMLSHMVADRCKLTAGDDVYSYENIFELTKHAFDVAMVSGRALYLMDGLLAIDKRSNILTTATQVIYENDSLIHRFKHFSYNNAPNLQYSTECLLHPLVREQLQNFDVVEDWPLQIAIARQFPKYQFKLIDEILVYYRRTAGSTYIVANERFKKDKHKIYDNLIDNEDNWLERMRLKSRKLCFSMNVKIIRMISNLDAYFFAFSVLLRFREIVVINSALKLNLDRHQDHCAEISRCAKSFYESEVAKTLV
jgi:glycosyltransferase involved in cell wall biosynthesis